VIILSLIKIKYNASKIIVSALFTINSMGKKVKILKLEFLSFFIHSNFNVLNIFTLFTTVTVLLLLHAIVVVIISKTK
jgi:hypothetical protein